MSDETDSDAGRPNKLGDYLKSVRQSLGMSLRDVEEATEKEYLS